MARLKIATVGALASSVLLALLILTSPAGARQPNLGKKTPIKTYSIKPWTVFTVRRNWSITHPRGQITLNVVNSQGLNQYGINTFAGNVSPAAAAKKIDLWSVSFAPLKFQKLTPTLYISHYRMLGGTAAICLAKKLTGGYLIENDEGEGSSPIPASETHILEQFFGDVSGTVYKSDL